MKSTTGRYSYRQVVMAITTRHRVGDVFCKASHRSITTSPKPLTHKPHHKQTSRKDRQAGSMFPTLPDRTDYFCGSVSRVGIQNRDPESGCISNYINPDTEDSRTQHLHSQHHHHPHHPQGEESYRIHGSCPGYCREERGCYRTLLDKLITTDTPGYRNFTRMQPSFFYLIEEGITPPPPPPPTPPHLRKSITNFRKPLEVGLKLAVTLRQEKVCLIHRGKLHFTAIPLDGWKNDHLQICPPGLQSHFERILT